MLNISFNIFRTQYGLYQEAVNISKTNNEEKWSKIVFWVFDAPHMSDVTYEVVYKYSTEPN